MSLHGSPTRGSTAAAQRERMLSMVAGGLGVLMFIFGFLKWLKEGDGDNAVKYGGYAVAMPTTAIIGLSIAAGLMALLGAMEKREGRGVPSAIPTALAATSVLLAIGVLLGKGSISHADGNKVGVEIGLILGLITALVQTAVLGMGLASRANDAADTRGDYGQPAGYGQVPPATQGYGQVPPATQGYSAPGAGTGYPPTTP